MDADVFPPPAKLDWCEKAKCASLPKHRAGLCAMAEFIRMHTHGVAEAPRRAYEKARLKALRNTRWQKILDDSRG